MGKLHSFKRHLNAEKVQIAEAKAYDQAQAAKALAQERKENDSKLVQEVLEVVGKNEEKLQALVDNWDKTGLLDGVKDNSACDKSLLIESQSKQLIE